MKFRLSTLFLFTAIVALTVGWLKDRSQLHELRQKHDKLATIQRAIERERQRVKKELERKGLENSRYGDLLLLDELNRLQNVLEGKTDYDRQVPFTVAFPPTSTK